MLGLIGRKVGMTQVFLENGAAVPVTVIVAGPCSVVEVRTAEKHGYSALQLGWGDVKETKLTKAEIGHLKSHGCGPVRHLREFRTESGEYKPGDKLTVDLFEVGSRVDVIGTSIGRGFQGVVKRHHFRGGPESHGCKTKDMPGSIGASAWPSHVIKGKRLPGQMGNKRITTKNLQVVRVDKDRNLVVLRGCVPGAINSLVQLRIAGKGRKKG
ncbi:MAG: 50S ribosomal protein L3 [Candidatus Eisenbacteria bacterium]|nr:50S ribosomal protein L3 [Candidatus Eisenbacteria bacterium]